MFRRSAPSVLELEVACAPTLYEPLFHGGAAIDTLLGGFSRPDLNYHKDSFDIDDPDDFLSIPLLKRHNKPFHISEIDKATDAIGYGVKDRGMDGDPLASLGSILIEVNAAAFEIVDEWFSHGQEPILRNT